MRARMILLAAEGAGVRETAKELGIGRATVQRWRARWRDSVGQPFAERLCDAARPGTPPTFTPEQIGAIIALACEALRDSERPFTHWTHAALAEAATERGIVETISAHSIGRFLREADLKPHRTRGWINSPKDADFAAKCADGCVRGLPAGPDTGGPVARCKACRCQSIAYGLISRRFRLCVRLRRE